MKTCRLILYILLSLLCFSSCDDDDELIDYANLKFVRIESRDIYLKAEKQIEVKAIFDSEETASKKFVWSALEPGLVEIITHEDNSATIIGLKEGQTLLKIESEDGKLKYFSNLFIEKAFVFEYPIYIDFGPLSSPAPFNNFNDPAVAVDHLRDEKGFDSEYSIKTDGPFGTINRPEIGNSLGFPAQVSNDMFFNDGIVVASSKLVVSNLKSSLKYTFVFFSAINDSNTENEYIVKGTNEVKAYLMTGHNTSGVAIVKDVIPDNDGKITITLQAGPNNTHWARFYCINAMLIAPEGYQGF